MNLLTFQLGRYKSSSLRGSRKTPLQTSYCKSFSIEQGGVRPRARSQLLPGIFDSSTHRKYQGMVVSRISSPGWCK